LQDVEARMAILNTEGAALEGHLSQSPPPSDFANLGRRLKAVNEELQMLEEQWLELSTALEAASA
jgi:ATP-binding cassette subfamily F protein 3